MKTLQFTNKELKALTELIYNGNGCSSGCAYPEMQSSNKDCDECEYTESINSIVNKLEEVNKNE